jgi:spermidine/putrescine transport system ATP-binding protein
MSDTIAVMNEGRILQIGRPEDIYNEPKNAFVAGFIGDSNIMPAVMLEDYLVRISGVPFPCVDKGFASNEPVEVVIRPEDVDIVPKESGMVKGVVRHLIFKGVHYEMLIEETSNTWKVHSTVMSPVGETVGIRIAPDLIHVMRINEEKPVGTPD